MGSQSLVLVGAGLLLVAFGLLAFAGGLSWFDRCPATSASRPRRAGCTFFTPLASMLVASLALTVVTALSRRMF